jgi:hypothetical protein
MATLAPAKTTRPGFRLTARDLRLLEFIASHRFVLAAHVTRWLGVDRAVAYRRLGGLTDLGLLTYVRPFDDQPGAYHVISAGLKLIQSPLSAPVIDLGCFRHDAALVWLQLAIEATAPSEMLTERQMRSADRDRSDEPFYLELHQLGPGGRPRRHYPDLVLLDPSGHRRAVELELTQKSRSRLELILIAYGAHPLIHVVTYITDTPAVAQALITTSTELGISEQVDVELTRQPVISTTPLLAPLTHTYAQEQR